MWEDARRVATLLAEETCSPDELRGIVGGSAHPPRGRTQEMAGPSNSTCRKGACLIKDGGIGCFDGTDCASGYCCSGGSLKYCGASGVIGGGCP